MTTRFPTCPRCGSLHTRSETTADGSIPYWTVMCAECGTALWIGVDQPEELFSARHNYTPPSYGGGIAKSGGKCVCSVSFLCFASTRHPVPAML